MILQTKSVSFHYSQDQIFQLPDLKLEAGQSLLILGKSGSGKTTMLHILAGLLQPKTGEVHIHGTNLYSLKGEKLDKFRGNHIGIIFQKPHVLSPLNVEDNLKLANFFAGQDHDSIDPLLEELGIGEKKEANVNTLSEGEAQRLSIARALVNRPKLILADEPTASLDDENAATVVALLQKQAEKLNAALVIVTHDQRVKDHIDQKILMEKKS